MACKENFDSYNFSVIEIALFFCLIGEFRIMNTTQVAVVGLWK